MQIVDFHCDALYKMWKSSEPLTYRTAPELETNLERLVSGKVKLQCFALYVPPTTKLEQQFQAILDQIDLFYEEVLRKNPELVHIRDWADLNMLREGQIGAMLTLEGVEAIGNDLQKLRILYQLGVRSVGLTWNHANLAADGAWETRNAGLTAFGKRIVELNNEHHILTDVSHLGERSFWDVLELAAYPIASHSNAKAICDHPRNLSDEQAKAMFARGGMIHVVFCPAFVKKGGNATIQDLIRHIDHFCALGGVGQIGLGSDFDGIVNYVEGLEHAGMMQDLINELLKHFSEREVRGFANENFLRNHPGLKGD
ncbi:dipeptidase [Brevibacillus ruminantium]|uniref:Dipeptidase n=1 Tax=Brevibacillus ruminantium TaxID=2950604 RepID=A0ABY4WIN5_9BACL|nr:dipeptidase [Brevibacillus ruminantium]USG67011.1 dipeptidase [Brevibacillus ruminantium]